LNIGAKTSTTGYFPTISSRGIRDSIVAGRVDKMWVGKMRLDKMWIGKMWRLRSAVVLLCALGAASVGVAQRYTSPPADASAKIAGKEVRVDYYAPSMHGRKIMGSLVPYGRVWCPGANVATGLTTEAALRIGDLKLPKGTYSIWAIPGEREWTLVINKQSGQHHLDYEQAEDFGRTKMNVKTLPSPVETLKFEVRPESGNKGTLALQWETTEASIAFTVVP
jgi:hypothetical protein